MDPSGSVIFQALYEKPPLYSPYCNRFDSFIGSEVNPSSKNKYKPPRCSPRLIYLSKQFIILTSRNSLCHEIFPKGLGLFSVCSSFKHAVMVSCALLVYKFLEMFSACEKKILEKNHEHTFNSIREAISPFQDK